MTGEIIANIFANKFIGLGIYFVKFWTHQAIRTYIIRIYFINVSFKQAYNILSIFINITIS